jgi:hypothetical protein
VSTGHAHQTREHDDMTPQGGAPDGARQGGGPERPSLKKLLLSCLINLIVPIGGYFLIRPQVDNDTLALGIVLAIPVVRTLWVAVAKRRMDPVGVLAVVGFGAAVLLSLVMGGSSTPIKFNEAMITGVLGAACLVSVLFGKPLHLMLVGGKQQGPVTPETARTSLIITVLIGITLLAHATVHVVFALTMSTGDFLIWSRAVGWAVILLGGGIVYWYVHGKQAKKPAAADGAEAPAQHR